MLITPGYTFLSRNVHYSTEHLYIIISPIIEEMVLFVNITSKKENSDVSCILNKGDHEFIRHQSIVNYADATEANVNKVREAITCLLFKPQKPITPEVVTKIQKGALKSEAFKPKYIRYIPV